MFYIQRKLNVVKKAKNKLQEEAGTKIDRRKFVSFSFLVLKIFISERLKAFEIFFKNRYLC